MLTGPIHTHRGRDYTRSGFMGGDAQESAYHRVPGVKIFRGYYNVQRRLKCQLVLNPLLHYLAAYIVFLAPKPQLPGRSQ